MRKPQDSSEICFAGGAALEAIAQAALDSIAKDGIGCTEHLERAMDKAAKGICLELITDTTRSTSVSGSSDGTPRPRLRTWSAPRWTGRTRRRRRSSRGRTTSTSRPTRCGPSSRNCVVFVGGVGSDGKPFRLSDTTTYVATTHRWSKFMKLLRAEFDRRFGQAPRKVVFISDGGKWITSVRSNEFPQSTFILDFYHAAEHLKPVLELMGQKKGSKKWKQKFGDFCKRMRQGKILSVIAAAEKACPESKEMRKALKYFRENEALGRMAYDKFIAAGLFIGSGVVESGCKTVLGERLKKSGMFWSLKGAKGMIPLRALEKSNRLEEFFNWRLRNLRQVVYTRAS